MKIGQVKTVSIVVAALLMLFLTGQVAAQERGTTRDAAPFIEGTQVTDDLDGDDDEYFYKFVAGPGKVTITFEVEANGTNAGAKLDLFGPKSKSVLSDLLAQGVDKGTERVTKSFKLAKKQEILIRLKGIKYGESGGTGTYTISLEGAIEAAAPAVPQQPAEPTKEPQQPLEAPKEPQKPIAF
jgi:hypothetical protein